MVACDACVDTWLHEDSAVSARQRAGQRRFVLLHVTLGVVLLFMTPILVAFDAWGRGVAPVMAVLGCVSVALALVMVRTGKPLIVQAVSIVAITAAMAALIWSLGGAGSAWAAMLVLPMLEAAQIRSAWSNRIAGAAAFSALGMLVLLNPVPLAFVNAALLFAAFGHISRTQRAIMRDGAAAVAEDKHKTQLLAAVGRTAVQMDAVGAVTMFAGGNLTLAVGDRLIDLVAEEDREDFRALIADNLAVASVRLWNAGTADWLWVALAKQSSSEAKAQLLTITPLGGTVVDGAGKSAERQNLLATMSHEMRTPLNAIIGFSDVLQKGVLGTQLGQREQEYVTLIRDSGEHLLDIVKATLDAARLEAGKYALTISDFNFAALAQSCQRMLLPVANEAGVQLICDTGGIHQAVSADERACRQTLINLVGNAIKFTPPGGRVELKIRTSGVQMIVTVSDTGIGIAADDLARLGEPFVQLDHNPNRALAGSGLGLSLVKGFVELHGGEMTIASKPDAGTQVKIVLPLRAVGRKPRASTNAIVPASAGSAQTIAAPVVSAAPIPVSRLA
jgi:cell cycle sensor histidine kinase DivJ